jgi:hypothetical protein
MSEPPGKLAMRGTRRKGGPSPNVIASYSCQSDAVTPPLNHATMGPGNPLPLPRWRLRLL